MPADFIAGLAPLPPWLLLSLLLGIINGAAFFVLFGRHLPRLAWYVAIGALAAGVGQVLAMAVNAPAPFLIGELNVAAASAATWAVLGLARVAGL